MVMAALIKNGYAILLPLGEQHRYDFAIERDGALARVQAKTGKVAEGCLLFTSCTHNRDTLVRTNYRGVVEWFGVYAPELDASFLVPVDLMPVTQGRLRLEPRTRHSGNPVPMASDFAL